MVNEFDKLFPVVLFKSMVGEIFGNLPWVLDAVVTKEVHSMRVGPDFVISDLEAALTDLPLFNVVCVFFPCMVNDLRQFFEVFRYLCRLA